MRAKGFMTIYFDTETTGLAPGRIIELAYVLDYGDRVEGKNFFFAVDYVPVEASKIHGITTEKLKVLSKGKTFSDYADEIQEDFLKADLIVAHNVKFDLNFINAEFSYLDLEFKFNEILDTMKYFTPILKILRKSGGYKYPKLSEVSESLGIYPYDATRFCREIFNEQDLSFHDARFDVAILYLSVKAQAERDENLKAIV